MSTLNAYRPNDVFADLRRDMDDTLATWLGRGRSLAAPPGDSWFAPLDVHESDKDYTVRVDAPGLTEKDLKVSCHNDVLTISGERKYEKSETRGAVRYTERSYGNFARSMRLPMHVAHDQIRARYTNGVLEVVVPKAPSSQQREIKVEV